ncbi:histidinol-phosphatase HisJ [Acetobacterium woodii]|uniref:Histidinol-phosphatase n=1 Tax=Acetobacterium woodii (strain ATCC 29683 / DSM 1030 / JCM 2381 / KCTC 1655 / WB1) TaxID=931626 RepID=H6LF58_ACEWD|nr:histidinol-phosphatase HisJ [Acetobacterium woodii]AFA48158.1 histidinol-phosphatase HisK [Acetobacterium woodii DSM 1030]
MLLANYHVHSDYCDGTNKLEEMVIAGVAAGLTSMGLSSHFPLPFSNDWTMKVENVKNYLDEIKRLKKKYTAIIELYCGMEIDYFIDRQDISDLAKKIIPQLDYNIMSIHTIGKTFGDDVSYIDESQSGFALGIEKYYHGNIQTFIKDYYEGIKNMVITFEPDILGHIDLIKKYNHDHYFFNENERWYQKIVTDCLDGIAKTKTKIEINTGANLRCPGVGRYPSDWIIPEMIKRHIPITIGGDSHSIAGIAYEYKEAETYLKKCGYQEYWMIKKGRWEVQPLGV